MSKDNVESIYGLSPLQMGMLFHSIYNDRSSAYVVVLHFRLQGALNVAAFKEAWQQVIDRHGVLRTFFLWEKRETPLQIVRRQVELPFQEHNWCHLSLAEQQEKVNAFLRAEREQGFDLTKAPLMRMSLVKTGQDDHHFIWTTITFLPMAGQ